jgi:hypothetical protein
MQDCRYETTPRFNGVAWYWQDLKERFNPPN